MTIHALYQIDEYEKDCISICGIVDDKSECMLTSKTK